VPARLLAVPYGPAATAAVAGVVAEAKGDDRLATVTVVVPSATVGTTLRRRLAHDAGGLAGVAFRSLPQVATLLAGFALGAEASLPGAVHCAHVRTVLAQARPPLAGVAGTAAAERSLGATFTELAELDDPALDALAACSARSAEVVRLHRQWRSATAGCADPRAVWRAAAGAVTSGTACLAEVGPLVVHLPRRLRPSEHGLLAALAAHHPIAVLVGLTGDAEADEPAQRLLGQLRATLRVSPVSTGGPPRPMPPTTVVRTPDPAEEAAVAARAVVEGVAGGTRPERIAVVSRMRDPYAALVHEALGAAGVEHHGPAPRTLAQTVAGRVLTGLLGLLDDDLARVAVIDWLRSGPVLDPRTGRPAPTSRWDRRARTAGVVAGRAQWTARLTLAAESRAEYLARSGGAVDRDHTLVELAALGAFIEHLAADLAAAPAGSWSALVEWADALLGRYLGDDDAVAAWRDLAGPDDQPGVDAEVRAHASVRDALRRLAALEGIGAPPGVVELRRAVADDLDRPAGGVGRFGHGVFVGRLLDVAGADLDLVLVLGLAEGDAPPRRPDDALLPARERAEAGGALAPRGLARDEEHRDLLAALAAAPRRVVTFPRVDPRAMRERQPSRWLLDGAGARAGRSLSAAALDDLRGADGADWFVDVESSEWWLVEGLPPASVAEAEMAGLLASHRHGVRSPDLLGHPVVVADPALARGLRAADHRRAGGFDAWNGRVGSVVDIVADLGVVPRSPTALERWAECPFRYFLSHVLDLRGVDDPTEADDVDARDLGSLVHRILERFVTERGLSRPPGEAWSAPDRARAHEIADEEAARLEAAGRTGRPLLWRMRWDALRRNLDRVLDADDISRRREAMAPVEVELAFGTAEADHPPVEVALRSGRRVRFKGYIDRVDASADRRRLAVVDYKTGNPDSHRKVRYGGEGEGDLTASGTKLQLPIYALAARQALAGGDRAVTVDTHYWSVDDRYPLGRYGGPFDDAAEARFVEVLEVVSDGIEAGHFPARPGGETWSRGGPVRQNCHYCDFDTICPTTRGERWETVRLDPRLSAYVALSDPDPGGGS
jgi:RecB family exonuclease